MNSPDISEFRSRFKEGNFIYPTVLKRFFGDDWRKVGEQMEADGFARKERTVYCPHCCHTFLRRLYVGDTCPHCDNELDIEAMKTDKESFVYVVK